MNRIAKWDNAKLILIVLVVICHFYENYLGCSDLVNSLFFSVYSFHMPAFFLISGLFAKRTINEKRIEKVLPYLLIYLLTKVLGWLTLRIIQGDFVEIDFVRESGVAWFILALFFMHVITFYTKRFRPAYMFTLSILLSMLAGYTNGDINFLCWLRVIIFYPFFYAGYVLSLEDVSKWLDHKIAKILSAFGIIVWFVVCYIGIDKLFWLRFLFTGRSYKFLEYGPLYGGILRLIAYVVSFVLVFMFLCVVPKRKFFVSAIGAKSLSIYVFHYSLVNIFVHSFLYKYLFQNFPDTWELLLCPIAILVTLICSIKPLDMCCRYLLNNEWKYRREAQEEKNQ